MNKNTQRKEILKRRKDQSDQYKIDSSKIICDTLLNLIQDKKVLSYYPTKNEVNILDFNNLKEVAYPITLEETIEFYETKYFKKGKLNIFEPDVSKSKKIDPNDYKVIIVPLVGFDKECNRLGHGKGYYDRFLKDKTILKVGVAYETQKEDHIIHNEYDIPMDYIVSEKHIYKNKTVL